MAAYTYSSNLLSDITEYGFCYGLILLDIKMPSVNGMELTKKIKPLLLNIRVIFITSGAAPLSGKRQDGRLAEKELYAWCRENSLRGVDFFAAGT